MSAKTPPIVGSALGALGLATLDFVATGGSITTAGLVGGAIAKGLEVGSALNTGLTIDAIKERFADEADYREVQSNSDLYRVLHQAVVHIIQEVADQIEPTDERSAKSLRFIATSGNPLVPLETLSIVEVFATTTGSLRTSGAGANGGAETLSHGEWENVFNAFLKRAKLSREWTHEKHRLAPEAHAPVLYQLHAYFPRAVRNVLAQDAKIGGRAFAKLQLLMLGEVLALVREIQKGASGETQAQAAAAEADLRAAETAFRDGLSEELRSQLKAVFERFDGLVVRIATEVNRMIDNQNEQFADVKVRLETLTQSQHDTGEPAPSLAPNKRTDHFMGREEVIDDTLKLLDEHPVVFICGPGGIGKSTLVRHLHDEARQRPWAAKGVNYVDLSAQMSASGVIGEVASAFSLRNVTDATSLVKGLVGGGAQLYILDDVEQALQSGDFDATCDFLRTLTTYRSEMRVLVTMRSQPEVQGAQLVRLERLQPPHDANLFRALTADRHQEDGEAEPLATLLEQLDGHALSIVLVAGRLPRGGSVTDLLAAWRADPMRLARERGRRRHDRSSSLPLALDFSYAALDAYSPEARALFVTFADLPAGASGEMLKALDAEEEAETLIRLSLLHEGGGRTMALVPVRHFAESKRDDVTEVESLRQRLDAYLLAFAQEANDHDPWFANEGAVRRAVVEEFPNLYSALDRADARDDDSYVVKMTCGLQRVMEREFGRPGVPQRLEAGVKSAEKLGDGRAIAALKLSAGDIAFNRGEYVEANRWYALSRIDAVFVRYDQGIARADFRIGNVFVARSEYEKALDRYTLSTSVFRLIRDRVGEGNACLGAGEVYRLTERLDEAGRSFVDASNAFQKAQDPIGRANAELYLGRVLLQRGDLSLAERSVVTARRIFQNKGDVRGEANAVLCIGDALLLRKKGIETFICYYAARAGYGVVGDPLGLGNAEQAIGKALAAYGRLEEAKPRFYAARKLFGRIADHRSAASVLLQIGNNEYLTGSNAAACSAWHEAISEMGLAGLSHIPWVVSLQAKVDQDCASLRGNTA